MKKVLIIDYGMGNIASIKNMLEYCGASVSVASNPKNSESFSHVILPGVGFFSLAVENLRKSGWLEQLNNMKNRGLNILGICLGAQIFGENSEEGNANGLGWFPVKSIKFPKETTEGKKVLVPHMGWTSINSLQPSRLLTGLADDNRFYFVHSYYMTCSSVFSGQAGTSYYNNIEFTSVLSKENIHGVQFHPEKSHQYGLKIFNNFLEM